MKSPFLVPLFLAFGLMCCTTPEPIQPVQVTSEPVSINRAYRKASALEVILNRYTAQGLPGVAMAVYTPADGYWAGASGFAQLENKMAMQPGHLQYGQSIAKTYMATAILKLAEAGRLDLDAPFTRYLPTADRFVRDAPTITVRMLLNHQSGVYDYAGAPDYVAHLLQHPLTSLAPNDLLAYVQGKPLSFTPGSHYEYSNTNYLLLSLLADQITGDHSRFIRENILQPAGLTQTFYHDRTDYLNRPELVNSYFDRFGNGKLENATRWQQTNVASMFGDDGLIASPLDYVRFLRSLAEGRQLSAASLRQMTTWVNGPSGKPTYGMGLFYTNHNGQFGYGHSGAGIGAGSALYYFPQKQTYVFIGVNVGTLTGGPAARLAEAMQNNLLDELLQ